MTDQPSISPRASTAAELKAQVEAERDGMPFLVFRDEKARHVIRALAEDDDRICVGRSPSADVPLAWDEEVSRIHAELARIGAEWALLDDGLSLNGSYVNGARVQGQRRLHDGDSLRIGNTVLLFRNPNEAAQRSTVASSPPAETVNFSPAQRRVLIALCRPFKDSTAFVTPASNEQIAGELFLSVDAVKKHLRALYEKFGIEQLPQLEKRARLVERAFAGSFVSEHDL